MFELLAANPNAWNPWWYVLVICAFASFIGFIQINSAWADKYKWNRKLLWISIAVGVLAILALWKLYATSTGKPG